MSPTLQEDGCRSRLGERFLRYCWMEPQAEFRTDKRLNETTGGGLGRRNPDLVKIEKETTLIGRNELPEEAGSAICHVDYGGISR